PLDVGDEIRLRRGPPLLHLRLRLRIPRRVDRRVERLDLRQPLQRQRERAAGDLLRPRDQDLLAPARGDREDARGELVALRLLEERGVLLAMEEVLVRL